jgi:hypothetical protein
LDYYGDWTNIDGYGHCWAPRVSAGWAPFRSGYWDLYDPWGPSWVSYEPWGWAPYHYGRWAFVQQRWFWVPVEVRTRRSYSPATVAFIPLAQDHIGWVPLAPGEVYVPRYYDASFRPRYLASREIVNEVTVQRTFVNLNTPSGVTVVPVQALKRKIEPNLIAQVDPQVIGKSKPVADPFAVAGVRELALKSKREGRKMKLAQAEQQAFDRPVLTSRKVTALPAETNAAKKLRAEPVSGEMKKKPLKIDQTGQVINARRPDGLPRALAPNEAKNGRDREPRGNPPTKQQPASGQQQEQLRQQMREQLKTQRQQQKQQKRLERKPPEASVQQQRTAPQGQMQRPQQEAARQEAARKAQQQRPQPQTRQPKPEKRRKPPEAFVRQQPRPDQGSQRRAMIEQRSRVDSRGLQAPEQFKPRARQERQQPAVREQAARSQASHRQTARPGPVRELNPVQAKHPVEKGKRKPS